MVGVSSAVVGASASYGGMGLWQYNRDSFMFNANVHQAKRFQTQSLLLARTALFREDIRDLAALTINKVDSYLIVNTLKLGFIVTIFFNFDRTDKGDSARTFIEEQVNVIFSMTLLTSCFWLLCSVWFSMHAVILAQSVTTKMLVQTLRMPLAAVSELDRSMERAEDYEASLSRAFRVPLWQRMARYADVWKPPMAPAPKAAPAAEVIPAVSIRDVLEGTVSLTPAEEIATIGYMEPHLKIYRLLHTSWAAFELYGQIAMEIGTTCLLSGLGYFSLFYLREVDTSDSFVVKGGGWASFGYLSISCWWSLIQCLNISLAGKIFLAVLTLAGPLFIAAKYFRFGDMQSTGLEFVPWAFPAIFTLQATWVLIICWSGVVRKDWPSYWNASRYVNVLHSDKGPPRGHDEVSNGPRQWLSQTRILDRPLSLSDTESEDSTPDFNPSTLASSLVAANLLLDSLDAVLEAEDLSGLKNLQSARNYLYEMTRAVSAIPKSAARSLRNVSGFWVKDASGTGCFPRAQRHHWVDPHDTNQGKTGPAVPCDELAEAAVHLGQLLFCSAENWTKMDMQQLEEYGGFPVSGARSFRAQFTKHLDKNALSGRWQFFGGVVINTVLWLTASAWSWQYTCDRHCMPEERAVDALAGSNLQLRLEPPWLAPASLGCGADGNSTSLAFADAAAGVFLERFDGSGWMGHWSGPIGPRGPCRHTLDADFGPFGRLWVACDDGLQLVTMPVFWEGHSDSPLAYKMDSFLSELRLPSLQLIALDEIPQPGVQLQGIVLSDSRLVGLGPDASGDWKILGTISSPIRSWTAISLRRSVAFAIDDRAQVFSFKAGTGEWEGPYQMPTDVVWKGVCAIHVTSWLALGTPGQENEQTRNRAPDTELWQFNKPSKEIPPGILEDIRNYKTSHDRQAADIH